MRRRLFQLFYTLLAVGWLVLIFSFSAQPAEESTQMSHHVGHIVGQYLVPGYSNWSPSKRDAFAAAIDYPVRKCAHASEYAVLAILLMHAFHSYLYEDEESNTCIFGKKLPVTLCRWEHALIPILITVCYAACDEFHQYFVPGRAAKFTDVLIDSAGGLAGGLIYSLAVKIRKRNNR